MSTSLDCYFYTVKQIKKGSCSASLVMFNISKSVGSLREVLSRCITVPVQEIHQAELVGFEYGPGR